MSCCLRTSPKPASWRRGKICVYRPKRCRILRVTEAHRPCTPPLHAFFAVHKGSVQGKAARKKEVVRKDRAVRKDYSVKDFVVVK